MLIPYRVKNPVRRFPYATLGIIGVNVIVYAFTTKYFLVIRDDIADAYGFALGLSPIINFFIAIFLHADITHIIGNMLFLWVFGPPVEDRLGIARYLVLYFSTGFVGALLEALVDVALVGSLTPVIGASGCIMGVVGAYWFLFPWSTVCVFYWWWYYHGVWEVQAIWVIGFYILFDLVSGLFSGVTGASSGVASFAHVGGGIAGMLLCLAMKAKRDTEAVSEAKALQADIKELENLPLDALQVMMEEDPGNPDLIRAAITSAARLGRHEVIDEAMSKAGPEMIEKDPLLVGYYLVELRGNPSIYSSIHLLRLAGLLERYERPDWALIIYRTIADARPKDPESEAALYRWAHCAWEAYHDERTARDCLNELMRRFPDGEMATFARSLLQRIEGNK